MIPIDRTNYREVRDAIEKRGGSVSISRVAVGVKPEIPYAKSVFVQWGPHEWSRRALCDDASPEKIASVLESELEREEGRRLDRNYERNAAAIMSDAFLREIEANLAAGPDFPSSLMTDECGHLLELRRTIDWPKIQPPFFLYGTDF